MPHSSLLDSLHLELFEQPDVDCEFFSNLLNRVVSLKPLKNYPVLRHINVQTTIKSPAISDPPPVSRRATS
jgi:hypothetical protein